MFLPSSYMAGIDDTAPTPCKPFTLSSNVCVGDLVVIIACSIAGLGFVFWSVHAIRKMRTQFPFTYKPGDDEVQPTDQHDGPDPFPIPSVMDDSLVRRGIVQTPSVPQRVRTRTALTGPDESYKPAGLAPISSDVYDVQGSETAPRMPPRAGGQSHRASGSLSPVGPYGEGYRYESEPYGEQYVSPSRARGSPPGRMPVSGGDYYRSRQSMNREDITYKGL